jgi:hypothetical protein
MVDIDYDDVARAVVGMAKYVDKIRPDAILLPLRSGWTTSKLVMEALRSNLGVSVEEYDPPVFPMVLNHLDFDISKQQLARLSNLRNEREFKEIYPKIERAMIIDHTNWCASPSFYLEKTANELAKFGEKVYVNFMAGSDKRCQKNTLKEANLLKDKRFEFHFSHIKEETIPFDDHSALIGIQSVEKSCNYVPYGFYFNGRYNSGDLYAIMGFSQELYKGVKEALNRRKDRDVQYRNKHHPKKEPALMISSEPKISVE